MNIYIYFNVFLVYCLLFTSLAVIFVCNKIKDASLSILSIIINKYSIDDCHWKFDHYSPSSWELYWYNNISILQNNICPTLMKTDQMEKSTEAIEYIIDLQKRIFNELVIPDKYDELFSKIFYRFESSKSSQINLIVSQYIEPLIGLLRDPFTICSYKNRPSNLIVLGENGLQSKRFFLLGPSAPYRNFQSSTRSIAPWLYRPDSQKILFDIGCSFFNGVINGTKSSPLKGTRWFYEYFSLNSLHFDRIIAFDEAQYPSQAFWNQIPDDLIGSFTFINVPVETKGKFNPWNILKSIAKIDDYVIIKLDIDRPMLENELIQQILNDTSISSLIDEMFFEMHVTVDEMLVFWGMQRGQLKDTYILFTKLRELGIRMHSWP